MNPILSIVICSRNDNYMGNSNWRLETTINFLASEVSKINKLKDIELIVVDWGSSIPLFCTLTLNQTAKQIIRFINVPISVATKTGEEGVFSDVIGVNVGIRHALGDFIIFSVSDILFTKSFLEKLFDILTGKYKIGEKVDKSLFIFNRKDVPIEIVNQDFNLSQISKYIEENGKKLPLPPLTPFYLAPSGAMMMHRCLWHDSHALDQRLIYRGWSDIDLCLRMRLKYSVVDMSEEEDMCLYHLDHYKPTVIQRKINPLVINPFAVNDENWGLADQEFEEFPKKTEFNPRYRNEMKKVVPPPDLNFRRKHLLSLLKFLLRNYSFGNLKIAASHSILIFEQYPDGSIQRIISGGLKLLRGVYRFLKKSTLLTKNIRIRVINKIIHLKKINVWNKVNLFFIKRVKPSKFKKTVPWSPIRIDIIIPAHEKDADILPYVIDGIRKNIYHPVENIIIISYNSEKILAICKDKRCIFVDENTVLPITKNDIKYIVNGVDRSGWLFQQLLKLGGDILSSQKHYLILDADTVFIKPKIFEYKGNFIFDCSDEYHKPYFDHYEKLLGVRTKCPLSFVCHNMLFEKTKLENLKKEIEKKHKTTWYEAIINNINKSEGSGFSEYETYGNYVFSHYSKEIILEYWYNLSLKRGEIENIANLEKRFSNEKYKSVSFHS